MPQFAVYDTATGAIRATILCQAQDVAANVRNGEAALEVDRRIRPAREYVDLTGEPSIVERPQMAVAEVITLGELGDLVLPENAVVTAGEHQAASESGPDVQALATALGEDAPRAGAPLAVLIEAFPYRAVTVHLDEA